MVRWGTTVVWFHATDGDSVMVFASAGFRNPFTQPFALSAEDADRWAEFAERLAVTPAATGATSAASASSASGYRVSVEPLSDTARLMLGVGDVILETASSSDGVALRMNIGANRQDGLIATLFPDGGEAAAAALHNAARTARSLHLSALVEAAAAASRSPASSVTSTSSAPTAVAGPSAVPVASGASQVSAVSLAAPTPGLAPVVVSATSVPVKGGVGGAGPGGVDDVTVRNLVQQWQPELLYCYTEYGVRSHPTLVGTVVVRMTLAPDGSVGHTAIASHSWTGGDAADVENCIRNRAAAWHFPPASSASVHEFPLNFAR